MHVRIFAFTVVLCCATACAPDSSHDTNKGLHTIDGVVPLYVDGAASGTTKPMLAPELIEQVTKMKNLGDALRILGPAYLAPDDTTHIPRWYFENKEILTLWPQGGEALADPISVYRQPNCGVPAQECKVLVLGRKARLTQHQANGDPQEITDPGPAFIEPHPGPAGNQKSTWDIIGQGLANTANGVAGTLLQHAAR